MKTVITDNALPCKVAEVQLSYRPKIKASDRPKVRSASDAYQILMQCWDKDKLQLVEQCKVMLIDRANRVLGVADISSGGMACTVVDPKLIFASALKSAASALLIAHSHPSCNLLPSEADKRLTERIKAGCKILEITFFDHLIVTAEGFTSFANEGLL